MTKRKRERSRHCGHRLMMRVHRAKRAHRELSAQGAAIQLLAIFAALVGAMPLVPSPPRKVSVPVPSPLPRPQMVRSLSVSEAMRHIRSARQLNPRVRASLDVLKRAAPSASEWIDDRAHWLEWSDLTRCLVPGDEDATSARLQQAASAWRIAKAPPEPKRGRKPKKGQDVVNSTFRP